MMTVSESPLQALYARLEEVLGSRHADTLMTYLPQEPGAHAATKADVAGMTTRLERLEESLDRRSEKIDGQFERMEERFHLIRDDLRDQMRFYSAMTVGAMTALTAIYAGLLVVVV